MEVQNGELNCVMSNAKIYFFAEEWHIPRVKRLALANPWEAQGHLVRGW